MEIELGRVLDSLPSMVWTALPDGRIDFVNWRWSQYTGLGLGDAHGWEWQAVVHPADLPHLLERWHLILASGAADEMEARVRGVDGQYRWFVVHCSPMCDDDGRILKWYGISTDIDDRKRAEDALRDDERGSRSIVDGIPGMVAVFSSSGELEFVNRQVLQFYGRTLEELKRWGTGEATHPEDLPRAMDVFARSLVSGEPFEMEVRARRSDGVYRWVQSRGFPLKAADGQIVRWYNLLVDIDERRRAEEALRASETNLRLIIDSIPGMVCTMNAAGQVQLLSRQILDYFGMTSEQLIGWQFTDAVHPDDLPRVLAAFTHSVGSGDPYDIEHRCRRADGVYRWFQVRALPVRDGDGQITGWYVVLVDIDDRKRAEDAVRASERNLQLTIDTIPVFVATYDPDGTRISVNRTWRDYMGVSLEEATGPGAQTFPHFHPDDAARNDRAWRAALARGEPLSIEVRVRRADGQYRWHLSRRVPLRDEQGNVVRWYSVGVDIDDQKRAEEALRRSEAQLAKAERELRVMLDSIPVLAWSARPDGTTEFFNQLYLDYVGLPAGRSEYWDLAAAVHPDDLDGLTASWQAILASGQAGEFEARLRRFDRQYRWFLFRANPLRDDAGSLIGWYGTNTDIDDRKRAEEALLASERQSRLVVDTIPGLVAVFGPNGEVEGLNRQFLAYLGQTREEFANWATNGTVHPDDLGRHIAAFQQSLDTGSPIDFETRLRRFDGVYRWIQIRGDAARDASAHIVRWYCLMIDVDERKRAEERLRRSEAFLADAQRLSRTGSFLWNVATGDLTWSDETYRIYELDPSVPVNFDIVRTRVHPDNLAHLQEVMATVRREGGDFDYETRLLMPDRSIKHLRVVARSARNENGELELRGAVQDVTERRLADEALGKARSELAHVSRVSSLGALTASIAHEVNQPLAGIITNASTCLRMLAADPPNVEGARETARRTIRDGNRAADVITRLRALFGKRPAAREPVDLNEAAREVIALSSGDLQRSRVVLRTELADPLPPVSGDRIQLQQVIMNLLRNAADAMNGTDGRQRLLLVRTEPDEDGHVRLSMQDSGIGFGTEGAERVFQAFYTTKSDGMGIGLSVSRSIVESHNGRLWAQANDGPGATFCFSIPGYSGGEMPIHDAGGPANSSAQNAAGFS
jgi:PAS domain S-box-containing protein